MRLLVRIANIPGKFRDREQHPASVSNPFISLCDTTFWKRALSLLKRTLFELVKTVVHMTREQEHVHLQTVLLQPCLSLSASTEAGKKSIKAYLNEEGQDTMAPSERWVVINEVDEESGLSTHSPVGETRLWTPAFADTAGQGDEWKDCTARAINPPIFHPHGSQRCFINILSFSPRGQVCPRHNSYCSLWSRASELLEGEDNAYVVLPTSTQEEGFLKFFPSTSQWDKKACAVKHVKCLAWTEHAKGFRKHFLKHLIGCVTVFLLVTFDCAVPQRHVSESTRTRRERNTAIGCELDLGSTAGLS